MAKALPKSIKDLMNYKKEWVSCQGDGKNMLILENGGKFIKDGLITKEPSFLVSLALPYP